MRVAALGVVTARRGVAEADGTEDGTQPIPWPLRDAAVSRRYRPAGPFTAIAEDALVRCGGVRGPLVVASCTGTVSTWDPEDWRESFSRTGAPAVVSAACASGLHALYLARAMIEAGAPEVTVLAVDVVTPPAHDNFEALRVLADDPAPYTAASDGFQLGEAAVALRVVPGDGIVGPVLGHDLEGEDGILRCLDALSPRGIEQLIGQGAGPAAGDRAELAALARHVPMTVPIATTLDRFGHTLGASSLLSVAIAAGAAMPHGPAGSALDGRPIDFRRAATTLVVCRALGGACGALLVGEGVQRPRGHLAWGPRSKPPAVRDETLRRIAAEADAQRPAEPPDVVVVTLEVPLPPAARIGQRILPTSVLEMTPGFVPQLIARAWGYRGPALCLVGRDPEPLLAALRATHERVFRVAIRGMHVRDVEWIARG